MDHHDARIPTSLWVDAQLRHLNQQGKSYYLVQKGAFAGGAVLLKINKLDGQARVLTQIRDMDGKLGWMSALSQERVAESEADQYIRRAMDRDPDLWVIEIEDKDGVNPFEGHQIL